ncbi:MAG: hypothetical protein HRT38_08800 [Alteromonadaceae bacterium]|nr:hypothetical protein [Alteromonadaceae bacterium]
MDDNYKKRAQMVGFICTVYSYMDYAISNVIWHLLKLDKETGIIVTGAMDIRPKIDMAIELADHTEEISDIRAKLQEFKNQGGKPNGFISRRNKIIHGICSSRNNDSVVMVESHRKKSQRARHELGYQEIVDTYQDISRSNDELVTLMVAHGINIH